MGKLTLKQRNHLNDILSNLKRAESYIKKDTTVICSKSNITAAKVDTYINEFTGEKVINHNKHIGTELCYLYNGIDKLFNFLECLND